MTTLTLQEVSCSGSPSALPSGPSSSPPYERPNVPPADELHAVREQIRRLTDRERELRAIMLDDPTARTGNTYAFEVITVTTSRTDVVEMRKAYPDLVAEFTLPVQQLRVEPRIITEDGELVRAKRARRR